MTQGCLIFPLVVTSLYALAFLVGVQLALNALGFAARLLYQLLPILLLVFALMFVFNLLLAPDWVRANMGISKKKNYYATRDVIDAVEYFWSSIK